jgi:purine-nucleoside phosphorylase
MSGSGLSYREQVCEAAAFVKTICREIPATAIQLGTGLGGLTEQVDIKHSISYKNIPHVPSATVESHQGALLIGRLNDCPVVILSGRFHYYEGYSTGEITLLIRVLQLLGVTMLVVTNAAGGLNPLFLPGTIMVIRDHLNFLGENPLRGPNIDEWGPRFPDFSEPYSPALVKAALDSADRCRIDRVVTGTYVCIPGPSLETPAETRWLRQCGADAVGMSTIPEVLVARHGSMQVLGLSLISNVNDPDNFKPILLEDIIEEGKRASSRLEKLIADVISHRQKN